MSNSLRILGGPQPNPELNDEEYDRLGEKYGSCTHCGTVTFDGGHGEYLNHCKECEDSMFANLVEYPVELAEKLEEMGSQWDGCECHDPRTLESIF